MRSGEGRGGTEQINPVFTISENCVSGINPGVSRIFNLDNRNLPSKMRGEYWLPRAIGFANALSRLLHFAKANEVGGASRDRTDDPLLAKQVLSQLSYSPEVVLPDVGLLRDLVFGGPRKTRTSDLALIRGAL